jgi:hypothetical protein
MKVSVYSDNKAIKVELLRTRNSKAQVHDAKVAKEGGKMQ